MSEQGCKHSGSIFFPVGLTAASLDALQCYDYYAKCKSSRRVVPGQADPPDSSRLPQDDIVGVTVLLLTCSYQNKVRSAACSLYSSWSWPFMQPV